MPWSRLRIPVLALASAVGLSACSYDDYGYGGVSVGYGGLWRFFDRRGVTVKKRPRTLPSRTVRTS